MYHCAVADGHSLVALMKWKAILRARVADRVIVASFWRESKVQGRREPPLHRSALGNYNQAPLSPQSSKYPSAPRQRKVPYEMYSGTFARPTRLATISTAEKMPARIMP